MRWFSNKRTKIIMLAPVIILFSVYIVIPVAMAFYYRFFRDRKTEFNWFYQLCKAF